MIWKRCTLYAETTDYENTDELGNPTKGTEQVWTGSVRFTPWTDQQIALEGRDVTKNEQLYAVPVSYDVVAFVRKAEIDGVMLKVTEVTDLAPRWSVIRVKVYGS
jgi:hypothetical protein